MHHGESECCVASHANTISFMICASMLVQNIIVYDEISVLSRLVKYEMSRLDTVEAYLVFAQGDGFLFTHLTL